MVLSEIVEAFIDIAKAEGANGWVYNDPARVNMIRDIGYPVFYIGQTGHSVSLDKPNRNYGLQLIWAGLMANDRSNELQLQSDAMEVLRRIVAHFCNENEAVVSCSELTFVPFIDRFTDICSGMSVTFTITIADDMCL